MRLIVPYRVARPHLNLTVCGIRDLAHDVVAVAIIISEDQHDVEDGRSEGKKLSRAGLSVGQAVLPKILYPLQIYQLQL